MKNNLQDCTSVSEQEIDFSDLQPLFDDHTRRLADILDCPAARPTFLNISDAPTLRFRMVRAWGILAILCLVATICWGIALWHYNYDIYYRLFTLFYMPQKKSRLTAYIVRHRSRRPSLRTLSNTFNSQFIIGNLKRTATIGIAASFTLVFVACASTIGDGYTLTQDHNARLEAVAGVTSIIEQI